MREADVAVGDSGFEAMGIEALIELSREAGIVEFEELECRGTGAIVQTKVESKYDEQRLSELDCVDTWEYIQGPNDGHYYVISFTAPALPDHLADTAEELIGTCEPKIGENSTTMSLVGDQDTIADVIRAYESVGVTTNLQKLGSYRGTSDPIDDLTTRQREVIETAVELGFYEVPREVSMEDIATALELDPSTVAEHLQRAERNVFTELF